MSKPVKIVLVMDRSGSMSSTKSDAEGGLREFVKTQRETPGEVDMTFYRFDNTVEKVFEARNLNHVEDAQLVLDPRGSTALLDALGRAIEETKERIEKELENAGGRYISLVKAGEPQRPKVIFVIITDGEENSSTKYNRQQIFDMIGELQGKEWEFIYLGANQDAIKEGMKFGFQSGHTMTYGQNNAGIANSYSLMSNVVAEARMTGGPIRAFSVQDRIKAMGKPSAGEFKPKDDSHKDMPGKFPHVSEVKK